MSLIENPNEPTQKGEVDSPTSSIKGFSIKKAVGNILGMPPELDSYWDVIDVYPKEGSAVLALVHYNESFDPTIRSQAPVRKLRGVIVDLQKSRVVADSHGYVESLPCYEPLIELQGPDNPTGIIQIHTDLYIYFNDAKSAPDETPKIKTGLREFDKSRTRMFLGYETVLIRIFKQNHRVFFSTHRKIDATRSHWGGRTPFYKLYMSLGGPPIESLFSEEADSPYCYSFLIVHNELRIASSTRDNRVIFIGVKKLWEPLPEEVGPEKPEGSAVYKVWFPSSEKPKETKELTEELTEELEKTEGTGKLFSSNLDHPLTVQVPIDVNTANKFLFPLRYAAEIPPTMKASEIGVELKDLEMVVAYNKDRTRVDEIYIKRSTEIPADKRLSGGDFIILYHENLQGETTVYQIESLAYEYRARITGDNPNLYNHFVVEMVNFTKADLNNPNDPIHSYPRYFKRGSEASLNTPEERQIYWWSIFYDAVSPYYKSTVEGFLARYKSDIGKVASFIIYDFPQIMNAPQGEEIKRIDEVTRGRFSNLRDLAYQTSRKRSYSERPGAERISLLSTVKGFLYRETGKSLYKMITTVQSIQKYRAKLNE